MEDKDIIHLWKSYEKHLADNLLLNRKNAAEITGIKIHSFLASMRPVKYFALLAGILWVAFIDTLLVSMFYTASPFFLVSMGIQSLLTTIAIGIYLYQLLLIEQIDISGPVLDTQEKLSRLKSSTLWCARLLWLQLPVWTTFYLHAGMFVKENSWLLAAQGIVTAGFTIAAVWFFRNIRYENRGRSWFRWLFEGKEWTPVIRSMEMLEEIKVFREGR
ncbi:hypothetical protein HF329_01795 [Chitinophaga oryzae]|uniref:Uncharacterized protein n=2 Tax=Chitinophaga oryzae TaxID=2725414 RepID=A0AAE6ZCL0_9BACT|nr:hypothetical protein [Chitinophaga oryzae]QJB30109.1 hypothetical protein HF329_01795 [Chitinophaga oryzae]